MSICDGLDEIIDAAFGVSHIGTRSPHYRNKSSCRHVSEQGPDEFDANALLDSMLSRVEENWETSSHRREVGPSEQNWRWKKQTFLAEQNQSKEKILEKQIIRLTGNDWVNQVPTASGLYDATSDKHRNVDLAHRVSDRRFELMELKVDSDHPLTATSEILQYAVLYLFARMNYPQEHLKTKSLLQARSISLRVLAPRDFYRGYDFAWMVPAFNTALGGLLQHKNVALEMDFGFLWFPPSFHWPWNDGEIRSALRAVTSVAIA